MRLTWLILLGVAAGVLLSASGVFAARTVKIEAKEAEDIRIVKAICPGALPATATTTTEAVPPRNCFDLVYETCAVDPTANFRDCAGVKVSLGDDRAVRRLFKRGFDAWKVEKKY